MRQGRNSELLSVKDAVRRVPEEVDFFGAGEHAICNANEGYWIPCACICMQRPVPEQ
jgi:hypothetical protein